MRTKIEVEIKMKNKRIGAKKLELETRAVRWFYLSIPFIMVILFWELLARAIHNSHILPPFSAVVVKAFSPSLAYHLGSTLAFSLLGLLIISLVGMPLGMLMRRYKKAEWTLNPLLWFLLFASGVGIAGIAPMLVVWFGLSQLTGLLHSVLIPILVVALISGYGERLTAVRVGFLLCWALRIGVEAMPGISNRGIGYILSKYAYFHNVEMVYAIMLLMGFTGLFVDRVLKYVGNVVIRKKERYKICKRPTDNGIANDLVNMYLDNVIVLLLVVSTIFSIRFNVGLLRIVCGLVFMLVLPGYVVINLFVDLFLFREIENSSRLIKLAVKIGEVLFGVVLSMTLIPIIGLLTHAVLEIDLRLVSLTAVLALYIVILSGLDMLVRKRYYRLSRGN